MTVEGRIRVVVPVLEHTSLFELAVPVGVFGLPLGADGQGWYDLTTCSTSPARHHAAGGLSLQTERGLDAILDADLVVVPACIMEGYEQPRALVEHLAEAHARGARVAGICSGAFILAEAGLLDGRQATTHWMYAEELRRRFPQVHVVEDALYVDQGSVLTSAGTAAGLDLCLHIVRNDFGSARAMQVSRRMVVAPHREGGQSQYAPARLPDTDGRGGLAAVLDWASSRLTQTLSVDDLAAQAGMSTRTLGRRFLEETGTTPVRWLNHQRVDRARALLETTDFPIDRVARESGLGTESNLRQHFRERLDTTPSAYRRAFSQPVGNPA
jgi:transcriptional regulator GlxA family with amidase domain